MLFVSRLCVLSVAVVGLSACATPQKEPEAGSPSEATRQSEADEVPRDDGAPCSSGEQCASGVCEGQGCGLDEGRCAPRMRACTKDLVTYCGCDGQTFQASGTCPGRTYASRGACEEPVAPR